MQLEGARRQPTCEAAANVWRAFAMSVCSKPTRADGYEQEGVLSGKSPALALEVSPLTSGDPGFLGTSLRMYASRVSRVLGSIGRVSRSVVCKGGAEVELG